MDLRTRLEALTGAGPPPPPELLPRSAHHGRLQRGGAVSQSVPTGQRLLDVVIGERSTKWSQNDGGFIEVALNQHGSHQGYKRFTNLLYNLRGGKLTAFTFRTARYSALEYQHHLVHSVLI